MSQLVPRPETDSAPPPPTAAIGHRFHPSVLREYDIRGVVGTTLSEDDARALGRVFGQLVASRGRHRIVVGYDGRHTSPMLEAALVDGLLESRVEVLRIGIGPSPMLYFAEHHLGADAGMMVTGSHNPPDHNGFKMVMDHRPVFGTQIQELGRRAAEEPPGVRRGEVRDVEVFEAYVARLLGGYDGARPLTVAWDAGNGATGDALVALTRKLPGRHILLNETIDGSFPAHHPDPTIPENLVQLQAAVKANGCDLGVGFDGDGDRIGVVDGRGRIVWGDQIIALLARDVLTRVPGATIIADVKASQSLFDDIAAHGGKPLMLKSGHSLLRNKLADTGAPLAGEMSGHIFFAERFYGHDDALYAAVRFVAMASRAKMSVAEMLDSLPHLVNTPELRLECDDVAKFDIVDRVKRHVIGQSARANDIDGVRVTTDDGWWLLRASNTQPMLVARCEAADEAGLERVKADLRSALAAVNASVPL